jgi:ABC-type dipeptide/oligopeptide/nickel transport system permease component
MAKKTESDGTYLLKLVLYLIIGSQWVRIESLPDWSVPVPIGLVVGLAFAFHDHFKIDRKIEFALLLVASFVGFWLPMGLVIQL